MGLADLVHHAHLQRDDRHRCPGLRQQLERAVEDGIVEDGLVELGLGHAARHPHAVGGHRGRCVGGDDRDRRSGSSRRPRGPIGRLGDRIGLRRGGGGRGVPLQPQRATQLGEEGLLRRILHPVGIADAHGHLIGELSVLDRRQRRRRIGDGHPLEQHVLIDARQGRTTLARQRLGGIAHRRAFDIGLAAVGQGRMHHDVEDGALLGGVHRRTPEGVGQGGKIDPGRQH